MSHSNGGFNHEIEYNCASLFKYLYFNYTVYVCIIDNLYNTSLIT